MAIDLHEARSAGDLQDRLDAFVERLTHDEAGRLRPAPERVALIDAARSLLDRLATGEPAPQPAPPGGVGSLERGQILANTYTVLDLVGCGGVAEVYRVRHRELRSERAVKILRPEHAVDPLMISMMADEARALLNISHPGVARARDLMRHGDGRPFILMSLVRGATLADHIRAGPLPLDAVIVLARRLAATLCAIHAAGYVHCDLSPDNVILPGCRVDAAVLVDFGVARDLRSDGARRPPVSFAGKLSFASPEQIAEARITPASDIYSLGLVLAAAVRGARLDMGRDDESARTARATLPSLRDVPPALAPVLRNLLQPDPQTRPTAQSLAEWLGGRVEGNPTAPARSMSRRGKGGR